MASTTRTLLNAVKPHVPSIKFPTREKIQLAFQEAKAAVSNAVQSSTSKSKKQSSSSEIDFTSLPAKYKRKPVSEEEIAIVQLGGAV